MKARDLLLLLNITMSQNDHANLEDWMQSCIDNAHAAIIESHCIRAEGRRAGLWYGTLRLMPPNASPTFRPDAALANKVDAVLRCCSDPTKG